MIGHGTPTPANAWPAALDLLDKDTVTSEMWKKPVRERAAALLESLKKKIRTV